MKPEDIGLLAGKVWNFLSKNGESEVSRIKFSLGVTNSELYLALGWLACERKISLRKEKDIQYAGLTGK
jgi:hypothetical protein